MGIPCSSRSSSTRGLPYARRLPSCEARINTRSWRSRDRMRRLGPLLPGIEAARGHPERPTALGDGVLGLLRRDPGEPYAWCFAKKAAAFFRMSRSVRSSRFSLRSRASSSRSAVVSPVRPPVRSARARSHPLAQRRFRQIEIAGDRADRLAVLEHQADGLRLELLIELPAGPPAFAVGHSGHRIHLSERCPRNRIKPKPGESADAASHVSLDNSRASGRPGIRRPIRSR